MIEMQAKEKPFCFQTPADQVNGVLRLSGRTFKVEVIGYSWESYTIHVASKVAKKLGLGKAGTLTHSGSVYDVTCMKRESLEDGKIEVELRREPDAQERRRMNRKKVVAHTPKAIALNQRDPVLGVATCLFIVIILMILPGWGENWGTSQYFTEGMRSVFESIGEAFKSLAG